jgi:hypothetical protein
LTNFHNGKQTKESLESGFPESEFRKTNMALEVEYLFWYFGVLLSFVGSDFFLAIMLTA